MTVRAAPSSFPRMEGSYDESKFAEMLVLAAELLASDQRGGATKLNKLLYFADFAHVRTHGRPISGVDYQRLEHGPAPRRLVPVRRELIADGSLDLAVETDALGYSTTRVLPKRSADRSRFDDSEIATLERVAGLLKSMTAAEATALSHDDPGWRLVATGETIPYEAAYLPIVDEIPAGIEDEVRQRAAELASAHQTRVASRSS